MVLQLANQTQMFSVSTASVETCNQTVNKIIVNSAHEICELHSHGWFLFVGCVAVLGIRFISCGCIALGFAYIPYVHNGFQQAKCTEVTLPYSLS